MSTDVSSKTQAVLEYIFRSRSPATAVFWVYASSTSRFIESYKRIALECNIPGHDNPELDTLQLVRDWLETQYSSEWLMIVDNVDDRTMFFEQKDDILTYKALVEYIPHAAKGGIIYTTRSRDVGIDLASGEEPIQVLPLSVQDSLSMLGERVTRGSSRADQMALLEELAYLPLAISQAAAFMVKRRKTVAEYIKLLRDESTKSRLLDHRTLHHGREDRSSESVTSTWWITFQHMKKENPRSAELLTIMCLLDRQQIPLAMLQGLSEETFDFDEAVGILEAFSLINTYPYTEVCDKAAIGSLFDRRMDLNDPALGFCDMHRLVQRSTRHWLDRPENDGLMIAAKALHLIVDVFPSGFYETWPLCRLLYPHANAILRYNFTNVDMLQYDDRNLYFRTTFDRSSLLHHLSTYSRQQANLKESEQRVTEAIALREEIMQPGNKHVLESLESFALTIALLGRREEALEIQRRVLEGTDKLLGPNHRRTLEALNQLGHSLRALGKYAEAEVQHRRELSAKRMLLDQDPGDPDLIDDLVIALNNVANVMRDQGEYEEAQSLLQEALERSEALQGQKHPLTWLSMESLAIIKGVLGKQEEAHLLFTQVIAWRREVYGDTHHSTLITRGQYMSLLSQEGKYSEAEEVAKSLLADEVVAYGFQSHSTLHNHGIILQQQKKYADAEIIFKRLLKLQRGDSKTEDKRPVGTSASTSRFFVRLCLEAQGKMDEVQDYESSSAGSSSTEEGFKDAQELHRKSRDAFNDGRAAEAEALAREELELRMQYAGLDNDATQTCLLTVARASHEQNPYNDTQTLTRQVLAYRKRVNGWRSVKTHEVLTFLAATVRDQGALEEAEGYYRQLVLWVDNTFGKLDVKTYEARWGLANVLSRLRRYHEAEELYRRNLQAQLDNPIESRPVDTAQAYFNLGCVLWYQGKNEEGEACFHHAYDRRVELFGESDARSTKVLCCLAEIVAQQAKCHLASQLYFLVGRTLELPPPDDDEEKALTENIDET